MQDLTPRGVPAHAAVPKGVAFDIADLFLVRSWADRNDLHMSISLDHGSAAGEEYEEVIMFRAMESPSCQFLLWRSAAAVFVQPAVGREKRFLSVIAVLESLFPIVLTDIIATQWPTTP